MVTETDNKVILEEMIRMAEKVKDPGMQLGDIIQKGDSETPPMVVSTLVSAGHVFIYDTETAERSIINKNMLTTKLRQTRPDGSPVFTTIKPSFAPRRGHLKCLLHPSNPNREEYNSLGFGVCRKSNLTSPMQVNLHMQHCHKTEWRTIQNQKEEKEKQAERELRLALLQTAISKKEVERTLMPKAAPVKEYRCNECSKIVSSPLALAGHMRSHKKK